VFGEEGWVTRPISRCVATSWFGGVRNPNSPSYRYPTTRPKKVQCLRDLTFLLAVLCTSLRATVCSSGLIAIRWGRRPPQRQACGVVWGLCVKSESAHCRFARFVPNRFSFHGTASGEGVRFSLSYRLHWYNLRSYISLPSAVRAFVHN
jgi:hypothetical protein